MATVTVEEVTLENFKQGIYHIACEDQLEADRLFETFKKRVLEEVIKTSNAKKAGKTPAQIIFERMKRNEGARHRERLRKNMLENDQKQGIRIPENTDCHHLVAIHEPLAEKTRAILRQYGIDIDSHHNGVRLPNSSKNVPHPDMPNAYNHKSVHTKTYYTNVTTDLIDLISEGNVTKSDIIDLLRSIAEDLVNGTYQIRKRP